jgi:hypothetical protein
LMMVIISLIPWLLSKSPGCIDVFRVIEAFMDVEFLK